MNTRERVILVALGVVLAAGMVFIVWRASAQKSDEGEPAARERGAVDTGRLPDRGEPLRQFETAGGVTVQVFVEGRGEERKPSQPMDVQYTGYSPDTGAVFDKGTLAGLVLEQRRVIDGWTEGLAGMRPLESRRLLVPSEMAYGAQGKGSIPPDADLVFDVRWVRLEITDLKEGTGKTAKLGSKILVHYRGTLEDGTVFDSSYDRNQPIEFTLQRGGLIEGWTRGIPGMKVGGMRRLWVPYHLAYGERAKGEKIRPYSDLTFEVELLDVN